MKVLRSISLAALLVFGRPQLGLAAEIVGLQNVALEADERVWGFEIHVHEGRIVAVCNVPQGWKITAENYGMRDVARMRDVAKNDKLQGRREAGRLTSCPDASSA